MTRFASNPLVALWGLFLFTFLWTISSVNYHNNGRITLSAPHFQHFSHVDVKTRFAEHQLNCLANNIYWESGNQSTAGKIAVAFVVMNRKSLKYFPSTICEVVHDGSFVQDGKMKRFSCQFSWTCDNKDHNIDMDNPIQKKAWDESYQVAYDVINHKIKMPSYLHGVINYHATYVNPAWCHDHKFTKVKKIGEHIFYRWKYALS